ncbi:MAG TPA: FecR family protein [Candidatus Binataceae bacterium]
MKLSQFVYARRFDLARRFAIAGVFVSAMILSPIAAAFAQAPAATPVGTFSAVTGDVQVIRAGATQPAAPGMVLNVGDRIITGPGAHAALDLTDQSKLEVSESSNLVLDEHAVPAGGGSAKTRIGLFGGLVRSFVHVTAGAPPDFEVHTPNAIAAARGTVYDSLYQEGSTRPSFADCKQFTDTSVYEGDVEVSNPTNPGGGSADVKAGYKATIACAAGPILLGAAAAGGISAGPFAAAGAVAGIGGVVGGLGSAGAFGTNQINNASPSK